MSQLKQESINRVIEILFDTYKNAKTELNHKNPYELLIATILSAQCTDVRVNIITKDLFKKFPDAKSMGNGSLEEIEDLIHSCGLYRNKAKNIKKTSEILYEEYKGEVPKDIDSLMTLPGVGRKTANVVVSNAFGIPAIAVDTHVFRVSNRIGLSDSSDVLETEKQLEKVIDENNWTQAHHSLILHGRRICKRRNPLCEECSIRGLCMYYQGEDNEDK